MGDPTVGYPQITCKGKTAMGTTLATLHEVFVGSPRGWGWGGGAGCLKGQICCGLCVGLVALHLQLCSDVSAHSSCASVSGYFLC